MESLDDYKELNDISECDNNDLDNLYELFGQPKKEINIQQNLRVNIVEFLREKEKDPKINYRKKINRQI